MFVNRNEIPVPLDEFLDTLHINKGDSDVWVRSKASKPKLHLQSRGSTRFDLRGRIAWMKAAIFEDFYHPNEDDCPLLKGPAWASLLPGSGFA